MKRNIVAVKPKESLRNVLKLLDKCDHFGFPVVRRVYNESSLDDDYNENAGIERHKSRKYRMRLLGMILRSQLRHKSLDSVMQVSPSEAEVLRGSLRRRQSERYLYSRFVVSAKIRMDSSSFFMEHPNARENFFDSGDEGDPMEMSVMDRKSWHRTDDTQTDASAFNSATQLMVSQKRNSDEEFALARLPSIDRKKTILDLTMVCICS
jgi:hypothetical protein